MAGSLSLMFKFSWETVLFESEGGFKMIEISYSQVMKRKLTTIL